MNAAVQIFAVGLGTYLIRVSAIALAGRFPEPSDSTRATMRLIAPAVLAAIVADRLFLDSGTVTVNSSWWIAAVVAAAVARRWRSAGITMAVGMAAVWTLDAVGFS
jgi:branched-subunit amino acid transport protein